MSFQHGYLYAIINAADNFLTWQVIRTKMEDWAKVVTDDREIIYINRITGKFIQEVGPPPTVNWEEFKSMKNECGKKRRKKSLVVTGRRN